MSGSVLAAVVLTIAVSQQGAASEPIKAALLTGASSHNWRFTSRMHKDTLEASGRFRVDIFDQPREFLSDAAAAGTYDLFLVDCDSESWGNAAQNALARRVASGAGLVIVGPSSRGFRDWNDWPALCALVPKAGAGEQEAGKFEIRVDPGHHPVTKDLAGIAAVRAALPTSLHNRYGTQHIVLAIGSRPDAKDSPGDVPVAWTSKFNNGRVFHTLIGNVLVSDPSTKNAVCDPMFKSLLCRGAEWAAKGEVTQPEAWADRRQHNQPLPGEKEAGWEVVFDGNTFGEWRGFKKATMPESGWVIDEGCIRHVARAGGGDIVLARDLGDFEFACEWKVAPGGNSGIFYRFDESLNAMHSTGPESQVLDNERHNDGKDPKTSAGAAYALYACEFDVARPAGEFNSVRIVAKGTRIEHWLNGFKVVEFDTESDDFRKRVSESKFKNSPDYGKLKRGAIGLQDHGDDVWFRNLKVRVLNE